MIVEDNENMRGSEAIVAEWRRDARVRGRPGRWPPTPSTPDGAMDIKMKEMDGITARVRSKLLPRSQHMIVSDTTTVLARAAREAGASEYVV